MNKDMMQAPAWNGPANMVNTLHFSDGATLDCILIPVEGEHGTTWTWAAAREGEAPDCWHDDTMWGVNENGLPSQQPVGWSLPPTPKEHD